MFRWPLLFASIYYLPYTLLERDKPPISRTCPFGSCFINCSKHHSFSLTVSSNICPSFIFFLEKKNPKNQQNSMANYSYHITPCNRWYCVSFLWFALSFSISPTERRQAKSSMFHWTIGKKSQHAFSGTQSLNTLVKKK